MGRAEIRAGAQSPPCTKCQDTRAIALARDTERARFQCVKDGCGELFSVPASQVPLRPAEDLPPPSTPARTTMPADFSSVEYCDKGCGQRFRWPPAKAAHEKTCDGPAEPERDGGEEPEEEIVASTDLKCRKCGRQFVHAKRKENHEVGCEGAKSSSVPPSQRAVDAAQRFAEGRKKAKDDESEPVRPAAAGGALGDAIAGLEAKRQAIVDFVLANHPDLRRVDEAIAALRKIESSGTQGGGQAPSSAGRVTA